MVNITREPGAQRPAVLQQRAGWASAFGVGLALFLVVLAAFVKVARTQLANADGMSAVLEADAIRHGNILLQGWTLSNVSFYTTDLWLYAVAIALRGFSPLLVHDVPALIYASVVTVGVRLAGGGERRRFVLPGMVLCFALVGLPSIMLTNLAFTGLLHEGTLLLVLLAFLVLDVFPERRLTPIRLAAAIICLAMATMGDTLAVYIGIVPLLLVSAIRYFQRNYFPSEYKVNNEETRVAGAAILSLVIALVSLKLIRHLGGFNLVAFQPAIVPLSELGRNLRLTVDGLLDLFGANVFGQALNAHVAMLLLRWLGLALVAYSFYRASSMLKTNWKERFSEDGPEQSRLTAVLLVASGVILAAYLFSNMAINIGTTRYLVPLYVFGAILAGRTGIESMRSRKIVTALTAIVLVANVAPFLRQLRQPRAPLSTARLTKWLNSRHLTNGYGSYWSANSATVESLGQIHIRPVMSDGQYILPMSWESSASWYRQEPAHFLVIDDTSTGSLTTATAIRAFGPPTEVDQIESGAVPSNPPLGNWTVLIWAKDITPLLKT